MGKLAGVVRESTARCPQVVKTKSGIRDSIKDWGKTVDPLQRNAAIAVESSGL